MSKRRRKLPLSDSGSDSNPDDLDSQTLPSSMDTDSRPNPTTADAPSTPRSTDALPGTDPRSSSDHARHSDPRSSPDLARSYDLCPSSDPARNTDPRPNSAAAPAQPTVVRSPDNDHSASSTSEPFLSPSGSYLVVKPCDDTVSFRKINVFWPQKQISAICGTADVEIEAPANGTLVLKTHSRVHTKALLKVTTFCGKKVTISLHQGRNTCKGTIFAPELRHMTEDEILSDLKGDGVIHIRRLTSFREGQRRDTNLLVLTFNSTSLPDTLVIGWLRKDVRVFVPNPLRCYKCQRFGHGSSTCRQTARCHKCGEAPHDGSDCTAPQLCLSCGSSDHLVSSSQCPVWKEEKGICELKAKSGLSYPEARRQVQSSKVTPTPGKSYAQAARTQTVSHSTQTDPLDVLPPLQLLKPHTSKNVTTSNVSTEAMMVDSQTSSPSSVESIAVEPPVAAQTSKKVAPRSPHSWTKVQDPGRMRPKGPPPRRGEQSTDRPSRPPIRVSLGRNRSASWASPSRGGGPSRT